MSTYRPQARSTAGQLLDFFAANPDEELSRSDVAVKFDVTPWSVDGCLRKAVDLGLIHKTKNEHGQVVFRAGLGPAAASEARHG